MTTLTIGPEGEIQLTSDLLDHLEMPDGGKVTVELLSDGTLMLKNEQDSGEGDLAQIAPQSDS